MKLMGTNKEMKRQMGENGIKFFEDNYAWPVIEQKYINIINQMKRR